MDYKTICSNPTAPIRYKHAVDFLKVFINNNNTHLGVVRMFKMCYWKVIKKIKTSMRFC